MAESSKTRIVVVDDEYVVRRALEMALEDQYELVSVESARLALAKVKEWTPNLMIVDIRMPEVDGFGCARMMIDEGFESVPIIFLTGHGIQADVQAAELPNVKELLRKPFTFEVIRDAIERVLGSQPAGESDETI